MDKPGWTRRGLTKRDKWHLYLPGHAISICGNGLRREDQRGLGTHTPGDGPVCKLCLRMQAQEVEK